MRYSDEIKNFAYNHREEYLRDLAELIKIPSVSEELVGATDEAPFGIHCVEALDAMMGYCDKYGIRTRTIGKIIGIAEHGSGIRELDIVSHLDVQPAGDGWVTEPFKMSVIDGRAFGRGVSDDKGPALATLYALRAIKELDIPLKKTVRLVFGTGEEYGISDIKYYTQAEPFPPFMFTPDSNFPIVNTSKAGYTARLSADFKSPDISPGIVSIDGGENRGAVPGLCSSVIHGISSKELSEYALKAEIRTGLPFEIKDQGDGSAKIICRGVSTHAVKADQGNNAVTAMLELLCSIPFSPCEGFKVLRSFSRSFPHGDVSGKEAGLYFCDDVSGGTLYNIGIFHYSPQGLEVQMRSTLPATAEEEGFTAMFTEKIEKAGVKLCEGSFSPGRHISLEDSYVKKLLESYQFHSGKKAYGIACGGGNYSHHFPNGVAFGCEPPDVDTRMHGAQEFVEIKDMLMSICIFAQSIIEICG